MRVGKRYARCELASTLHTHRATLTSRLPACIGPSEVPLRRRSLAHPSLDFRRFLFVKIVVEPKSVLLAISFFFLVPAEQIAYLSFSEVLIHCAPVGYSFCPGAGAL